MTGRERREESTENEDNRSDAEDQEEKRKSSPRCPGGLKLRVEFAERRNGGPKRRRGPVRTAKEPRRAVQSLRLALREDRGRERSGSGRGRPGVVRRGGDGLFRDQLYLDPGGDHPGQRPGAPDRGLGTGRSDQARPPLQQERGAYPRAGEPRARLLRAGDPPAFSRSRASRAGHLGGFHRTSCP